MQWLKNFIFCPFWQSPFFNSILTGFLFGIVLLLINRLWEKRDVLSSISSELAWNYQSLKRIQDISEVEDIQSYAGMIEAYKKNNPEKITLSDKDIVLDIFKNMPMDQELSINNFINMQSQIAKYSKDHHKYIEIYTIVNRIIRFSKIKSGEIKTENKALLMSVNQLGAIRRNSEEFIKNYEENFPKK